MSRTPDKIIAEQIIIRLQAGERGKDIAESLGISESLVSKTRKNNKSSVVPILNVTNTSDKKTVQTVLGESVGSLDIHVSHAKNKPPRWLDIKNPEKLLKECEIDISVWAVHSVRVSSSEVTMKLRKRDNKDREDIPVTYTNVHVSIQLKRRSISEQAITSLCNRLLGGKYKPSIHKYKMSKESVLLEWCPYDQHHGLLAWKPEVDENWDLKISADFFDAAAIDVLNKASQFNIGQIIIPIGQDWFHCDDPTYQTPMGKHRLDIEGRLLKVFETGYWSLFRGIERFRQIAPVHLLWIPGNHDPHTSYYLTRALAAHYMDLNGKYNSGVTVDYAPASRKIYRWGKNCIGFSHPLRKASWERQRGIFAEIFKHEWADADFHEIHTGHLHKIMEYEFMQADTLGSHTVIRMLPSLCASDKWHWEMGFVEKNRASASFIWSENDGLMCQFTTRVKEEEKQC